MRVLSKAHFSYLLLGLGSVLVLLWTSGCASLLNNNARQSTVELAQDATVTEWERGPIKKKKGESFVVSDKPVLVESEGFIPAMLLPLDAAGTGKLDLRPVDRIDGAALHRRESVIFSTLLSGVSDVQVSLASRKPYDALSKAESLISKYPDIVALKFLKASCLVALGRQREAKALLEQGLKEFPNDKYAKRMLQVLSSGSNSYTDEDEKKSRDGSGDDGGQP